MDYYAIINGQKKGPFDTISIIKQIHAGNITAETQIADNFDGDYQPASSYPMISEIFNNQQFTSQNTGTGTQIKLGRSLKDGVDLWSRYALSFTITSGIILAVTFALSNAFSRIPAIADYPFLISYMVSFIASFLYINFFGYIIFAKRSQALEIDKYLAQMKSGLASTLSFAAILAVFPTVNSINPLLGIAAMIAFLLYATLGAFTPFMIFDKGLGMSKAYGESSRRIRKGGSDVIGVVLAIVAANIIVAILPAIFIPKLFIFGLFISIPITASSLAYIYDEISG